MKILIVDDSSENVALVRDILYGTGYTLLSAGDGLSGIRITQEELPDLVLLDVNMPGMSGFEVCKALKEDPQTASIPIIMITALADVDHRVQGLAVGADDYLGKPFSPRELLARVDRSLKSKMVSDTLRQRQIELRRTFERFVAPSVVEQLLNNPDQVKLGGRLQEVTVMFSDLEGFTSLSERTDPEVLLQLLNRYHAFMVRLILMYGGTIDKFIGDGVMSLFNTPIEQEDHSARAVKASLHIQDELYWFHQDLPQEHRLPINFGIHSGLAVVGNVGTDRIMNFTAVGDTVNVASRLQDLAEGGRIFVSEEVFRATESFVFGRNRGAFTLKGRTKVVQIYEISNSLFE